jgi:hypothetical protein
MKSKLSVFGAALIVLAIIAAVIAWNVSIWQECRSDHSWSYCMRVLSK